MSLELLVIIVYICCLLAAAPKGLLKGPTTPSLQQSQGDSTGPGTLTADLVQLSFLGALQFPVSNNLPSSRFQFAHLVKVSCVDGPKQLYRTAVRQVPELICAEHDWYRASSTQISLRQRNTSYLRHSTLLIPLSAPHCGDGTGPPGRGLLRPTRQIA